MASQADDNTMQTGRPEGIAESIWKLLDEVGEKASKEHPMDDNLLEAVILVLGQHPDVLSKLDETGVRQVARRAVFKCSQAGAGSSPKALLSYSLEDHLVDRGVFDIMGGKRVLKEPPSTRAGVHALIMKGLPYAALVHVINHSSVLKDEEVAEAVGISTRTLRRQKETPAKPMPPDLASRTWSFAETLAKATGVMGGREAAERWMSTPAMGLDGQRPIDLLRTLQGAELVNEFLDRLDYGVYN